MTDSSGNSASNTRTASTFSPTSVSSSGSVIGPVSVAVVYLTAEERRLGDDRKHVSA